MSSPVAHRPDPDLEARGIQDGPAEDYPSYTAHQGAWEELAGAIAASRDRVLRREPVAPGSRPGRLTILGSGIETIGFSVGDLALIEAADKVLFCVADPATIVWLKRMRPDALDLYVLYGDDKIRYTTYMQMAEAQLHWVREGLDVVVVFYGHPGIFVLSTHRAVSLARAEGHQAVMKAGVSALDTLCADLGVDPSHPGMTTFEATDALVRRRRIDTSLHVVLWQVGLIGELGYRRHGYLNSHFSYFVTWLEEIYGSDFEVTHYIGSRYPTVEPLVERHTLRRLHDPDVQETITGLSTFYLPPRDVVPTDRRTALDLGMIEPGQSLVTPASPLREIDAYGPREAAAFDAFARFRIPSSYRWQDDTGASDFLIALRFDPDLQALYAQDPLAALSDPRFEALTDRERSLLASRDGGQMQVAAKGGGRRSPDNERLLGRLLASKADSRTVLDLLRGATREEGRQAFARWAAEQGLAPEWAHVHASLDHLTRTHLHPWTGVYGGGEGEPVVTLVGHGGTPQRSLLYVDSERVRRFTYSSGVLRWPAQDGVSRHGKLKVDTDPRGARRLVGRLWSARESPEETPLHTLSAVDPQRSSMAQVAALPSDPGAHDGWYVLRQTGRYARQPRSLELREGSVTIDGDAVGHVEVDARSLRWRGGPAVCEEGELRFVVDPAIGSHEVFGTVLSGEGEGRLTAYGARQQPEAAYQGPPMAAAAGRIVAQIALGGLSTGGLMLWHKWEKADFTHRLVCTTLARFL